MTRPPRPLLPSSTSRVARVVLGGVLWWVGIQTSAWAQTTQTLQVQLGDTASTLALPLVPAGATLDQMLLALLQTNPEAFIDGNVNLLRAGQTLRLPDTAQILRTSAEQARDTVLDHHHRFREYAQRLAGQAHTLAEGPARELSGKVSQSAPVRNSPGSEQDRLTLTKDLQDAQALKIAVEKQTQEAMAHLAALQKNIAQLQQLSQAVPEASAASTASPSSAKPSPRLPLWAAAAGFLAAALGLAFAWQRRRAAIRQAMPPATPALVVPPQMAGISLDLDSPAADAGTDRQP